MPFPEALKQEVRKRAAFRCCRCQNIGIDIHHIIPESEGGPSDIENAAPLCQNCHDQFGDNPKKRKEIKEMRDYWYEKCASSFSPNNNDFISGKLEEINKTVNSIQAGQQELMPNLRACFMQIFEESLNHITPHSSTVFVSEMLKIFQEQINSGSIKPHPVFQHVACPKCYAPINELIEELHGDVYHNILELRCPHCGWTDWGEV